MLLVELPVGLTVVVDDETFIRNLLALIAPSFKGIEYRMLQNILDQMSGNKNFVVVIVNTFNIRQLPL